MKMIKVGGRDYVMKFTTHVTNLMNAEGITIKAIQADLKDNFDNSKLNKAFYYSLKEMQRDITVEEAYRILDTWIEEGMDGEEIQKTVIGEYMYAMGFKKQFKQALEQAKK